MVVDNTEKPFVLIVDDIADNALLLEFILGSDNYEIKCATSVAEAVDIMGGKLPDIILTDITMPDVDGFEFMTMLKNNNRTKDIPIVVISGLESNEDKQRAFEIGAVSFLGKPYDRFEIQNNIAINVKLRLMQKELEEYNKRLNAMVEQQHKRIEQEQKHILIAITKIAEFERESGRESGEDRLKKLSYNARLLAQSLSFVREYEEYISKDYLDTIEVASLLHDIGKISGGVSGKRDTFEHTEKGARILEEVYSECPRNRFLSMAILIARYHHHDFFSKDPEMCQGDNIPLSARIMRVIDDYYYYCNNMDENNFKDKEDVLKYMEKYSGKWYDPEILKVFMKIEGQMI